VRSNASVICDVERKEMQMSEHEQLPWNERRWNIGSLVGLSAGSKEAGIISHGTFADGTPLQNVVHVLVGGEAGPVLYVQAAVHGDEVNGVEVLRRVVTSLEPQQMKGVLIVVPVVNGPSFMQHQRRNPFDIEDMNRVWPGSATGSISQQMANNLYRQAIRHAQYVIDLHTANSNTLLHVVYGQGDEKSRRLAEVFGLEVLLEEEITEDLRRSRFTGKLRNTLTAQGVTAITPELGGNNRFEEGHIKLGERGVLNVMKYLGMIQGEVVPPDKPQITLYGSHLDKVKGSQGGIWIAQVRAGDRVSKGQLLGYIYALGTFEVVEKLVAPYDGYVLGTADVPIVNIGDGVANVCKLS
jgi:predicted deacylase